jgi:uncharacterized SAM-binding protein YcdF (DUF218 family)
MDWFAAKKLLTPLLYPVPAVLLALGLGLFFLWITPWKRAGRLLVTLGALLLGALSWGPVADSLVRPLERQYRPLVFHQGLRDVRWVVVLGGGHVSDPMLPPTGQLDEASLVRLAEGIRIHRLLPRSRLLLSGGRLHDPVSHAQVMAEAAASLGVDPKNMLLEANSRDTQDQAVEIRRLVGDEPFVLVSSAVHMPRAMELFRAQGMRPIAAPTGHTVRDPREQSPTRHYPSAENLRKTSRAIHEYLGLAWIRVRNSFSAPPGV